MVPNQLVGPAQREEPTGTNPRTDCMTKWWGMRVAQGVVIIESYTSAVTPGTGED